MGKGPKKSHATNGANGHGNPNTNGSQKPLNISTTAANKAATTAKKSKKKSGQFSIHLTIGFLLLTLSLSILLAFSIGWIARVVLLSNFGLLSTPYPRGKAAKTGKLPTNEDENPFSSSSSALVTLPLDEDGSRGMSGKHVQLPSPKIIAGKEVPYTTYTSKTFHTAAATTSNTLHIDRSSSSLTTKAKKDAGLVDFGTESRDRADGADSSDAESKKSSEEDAKGWVPCHADGSKACSRGKGGVTTASNASDNDSNDSNDSSESEDDEPSNDYSHNSDADGLHLPAGQHLLVDIKDVDSSFLNSEERLAKAMIELIDESKLTLLSYHCHSLVPIGVSCVGVLLESHISFHTWPLEGVITLDLFTCGGNPLIPVLPSIERLFAVPRVSEGGDEGDGGDASDVSDAEPPALLWAHKLRGFREGFAPNYKRESNHLENDLGQYILGKLDFDIKRPILSTKTDFQTVDIYELIYPRFRDVVSYHKSLSGDGSYEAQHPELFAPDKVFLLDGTMQSSLYGDAAYHESIAHPVMLTHPNPKRVAIIGGGEGATLREILKHDSVEEVVMIEIDEEVVTISRDYLREWCDCSDIVGSADWCLEDERVEARYEDAIQYFKDHFGKGVGSEAPYDVIIMDALDPNIDIDFAMDLYNSEAFVKSLYNGLTESGILAVQVGETPALSYPADEMGPFLNRALMTHHLEQVGFRSMHAFEESHSGFTWPWSTLVAFKDYQSRTNWYRNPTEIDIEIRKRMRPTKSGASPLRYYDGATHFGYQSPPKPFETVYCRALVTPEECNKYRGFSPSEINVPGSQLELKMAAGGEAKEVVGVISRADISKNSVIALDQRVQSLVVYPKTLAVVKSIASKKVGGSVSVTSSANKLVQYMEKYGICESNVLGGMHCFADVGIRSLSKSANDDTSNLGYHSLSENNKALVYSPVVDRHLRQLLVPSKFALTDIPAGEEIIKGFSAGR